MHTEKLHKILARGGIASRRRCEDLIRQGRVSVDGTVVRDVATRVDAAAARISVDGEPLREPRKVHLLFHKPRGVVCTSHPDERKPRVLDYFRGWDLRLFPVGRLDEDSEGLLLVTNDGGFCQAIAHPRHGVPKTYDVFVTGRIRTEDVERIARGVWISEGKTHVDAVRVRRRRGDASVVRVTLSEGKNREIRRIFARLGYRVRHLRRIAIGPVAIGTLGPGRHRRLTSDEVRALLEAAGPRRRAGSEGPSGPRRGGKAPDSSRPGVREG